VYARPTRRGRPIDKPFTSDHCTFVREFDQATCCVEHDWRYWQGGTRKQRAEADRLFRECLKETKHNHAWLRWFGVRVMGAGFLPTSWRWGYGWKWPRSAPRRSRRPNFDTDNQREVYDAILKNARFADGQAKTTKNPGADADDHG